MAAESSWSLRGVDPRAREFARSAAKREGITIGEWLNRQLLEDTANAADPREQHNPRAQRANDDLRKTGPRESGHDGAYDEPEALAHVLDRLSRRIEATEHRSTLAITGIDQSVLGVISRLQSAEDLQSEFSNRYEAALSQLRDTQGALGDRIGQMEREGRDAGALEALKSLEEALSKVANQIYDSEADTKSRIAALKSDIERATKRADGRVDIVVRDLDDRIADVERKVETDFSDVTETVAREVGMAAKKLGRDVEIATRKVEKVEKDVRFVREEMLRAKGEIEDIIADRADAGHEQIETLEGAVTDINERLGSAERVTDHAIKALERSFRELDGRVKRTETRLESLGAVADRDTFAAEIETRFEALSRELSDMVTTTRADIAKKMVSVASDVKPQQLEERLGGVLTQIAAAETRQRDTLERIGGEVAKLAGAVEARVRKSEAQVETRLGAAGAAIADAVQKVDTAAKQSKATSDRIDAVAEGIGATSDKIDAVDAKLEAAKLGAANATSTGDTAGLSKELTAISQRIADAEASSTAAVGEVTKRVDLLSERFNARREETGEELTRRIRESEDRTRTMVDDAMGDVNKRLDDSDDQTASVLSPVQRALDALRSRLESLEGGSPVTIAPAATMTPFADDIAPPPFEDDLEAFDADAEDLSDFTDALELNDDLELDTESTRDTNTDDVPEGDFVLEFDEELHALENGADALDPPVETDLDTAPSDADAAPDAADETASEDAHSLEIDDDFELELDIDVSDDDASDTQTLATTDTDDADTLTFNDGDGDSDSGVLDVPEGDASFDLAFGKALDDNDASTAFDPFAGDKPGSAPPSDFLDAARQAARAASDTAPQDTDAQPGFGPTAAPAKSKKSRGLLVAASGLAFLAVGAAGVIVLNDAGRRQAAEDVRGGPLEGLVSSSVAETGAELPAAAIDDAAFTADIYTEPTFPIALGAAAGADFSLYADGGALFAPIRPDLPEAAAALTGALLTAQAAAPQAPSAPPVAPRPEPEAVVDTSAPAEAAPEASIDAAVNAPVEASVQDAGEALAGAAPIETTVSEPDSSIADTAAPTITPERVESGLEIDAVPAAIVDAAPLPDIAAPTVETTTPASSALTMESAAADGDPMAQYELGVARLDAGNTAEGVRLLRQSAENGLAPAQYRLGKLFETGSGVELDLAQARRWTERAANAGHVKAMHNLGIFYAEGRGAEQNFEEAGRWFEEAALLGSADSQYNLAVLYEQGLGMPLSLPDAYAWFSITANAGDEDAGLRAENVGGRLAPLAKERADEAVRRFLPRPVDEAANGVFRDTPWGAVDADLGVSIARAQTALTRLGYAPGPADGATGPMTVAAIRTYQTSIGVQATGEIDASLLERLEADANAL